MLNFYNNYEFKLFLYQAVKISKNSPHKLKNDGHQIEKLSTGAFPGFWSEGGLIIPNGNFCPTVLFLLIFRYLLRLLTFKYILIKLNNKCICKFISKYFYKPCHFWVENNHFEKKIVIVRRNCVTHIKTVTFEVKLPFFW